MQNEADVSPGCMELTEALLSVISACDNAVEGNSEIE